MVKTEVIVLRSVDYSESSQVSTVFSYEHGKTALMVRGSRKPKSPFSGKFEPGQILQVVYTYKPTRSVQTLTEATYSCRLDRLRSDVPRMALMMSTLELISQLLHDDEVNQPIYDFAKEVLIWMNDHERVLPALFPYLQVRLAQLMGLDLQTDDADKGGNAPESNGYLNIDIGLLSSRAKTEHAIGLSAPQFQFLLNCCHSRKVALVEQPISNEDLKQLIEGMDRYFKYHLDGLKPRRSDAIFDLILND